MKIIVYSQPNCGECKMVKAFLNHHNIEFKEKDIRKDKEAYDTLIQANFRSTPVTFINEESIAGFDIESLEKELQLHGLIK